MNRPKIVIMPRGGIGKTLLPEALRVLKGVNSEADCIQADIEWNDWGKRGNSLSQRTLDLLKGHRICLFGAIASKTKDQADRELNPEPQNKKPRIP
jgi:3-isopropylmalate dehydrogenase